MLDEYRNRINLGVGCGFLLVLLARVIELKTIVFLPPLTPIIITLVGMVVFVWGCVNYALAKGRHPLWGMLGILSIFGLLALVFLPDKHKKQSNKSL